MQIFEIDGNTFQGFLSTPSTGKGFGVLMLHAWWGLNSFVMQTCDRLARVGFVTLAPDYYHGTVAETIEEAKAAREKLDRSSWWELKRRRTPYKILVFKANRHCIYPLV